MPSCSMVLAKGFLMLVLVVVLAILIRPAPRTGLSISRQPLPASLVQETDYYTDQLGWIADPPTLLAGMENFYLRTGVQPYLFLLAPSPDGPDITPEGLAGYADGLYDTLFEDEGHFLVVYSEVDGEYSVGYTVGSDAALLLDQEALAVFQQNFERLYTSDLGDEAFFAAVFSDTAAEIMAAQELPDSYDLWDSPVWNLALATGICAVLWGIWRWLRRRKAKKEAEARRLEQMLNTPLETFGEGKAEELAEKYE